MNKPDHNPIQNNGRVHNAFKQMLWPENYDEMMFIQAYLYEDHSCSQKYLDAYFLLKASTRQSVCYKLQKINFIWRIH